MTRLHFLLCVMCFQWAFMKLALGFEDNGSLRNPESPISGLYFFQACSSKAYFVCRVHRWKSMTLRTHLRGVSQRKTAVTYTFLTSQIMCSINPSNVTNESMHIFLNQVKIPWLMTRMTMISTQWRGCWSSTSGDWRTPSSQRSASWTSSLLSVSHTQQNIFKAIAVVIVPGKWKRENTLCRNSALLKKQKACRAAHGSNLNTRALCLIFNRKPIGRGEILVISLPCASSPQNHFPAGSTVIVWSHSVLQGSGESQERATIKVLNNRLLTPLPFPSAYFDQFYMLRLSMVSLCTVL